MVRTQRNAEFHFANIGLAQLKLFSRKLTPFDMDTGSMVTEIKVFDEEKRIYRPVKLDSFVSVGFSRHRFTWDKEKEG